GAQRLTEAALEREKQAKQGLDEARRDLGRLSYYRAVDLAQREWRENEVARAEQLVQGCPESLRGWGGHYCRRLVHSELFACWGHTNSVNAITFSPDGRCLASASTDYTVRVWDAQTGQEIRTLRGEPMRAFTSVAFSPDGRRLASAAHGRGSSSDPGELRVWDLETGQETLSLREPTGWINGVAYSPDGRL